MIDRNPAIELLKSGLQSSTADQTELVLIGEDFSLTRFSESQIRDNMFRSESTVFVRAISEKRIGITSTTDLTADKIEKAVRDACEIATLVPPDEDFSSLPEPQQGESATTFYPKTAEYSPLQRADDVSRIVTVGKENSLQSAGAYETTAETLAVVNSLGVEQYYRGTLAELSLTYSGARDNSGWALGYARDISEVDVAALALRAAGKAADSIDPIGLESGQYTVILEPPAVGQLLLFLAFMGFGAKTLLQHRSFMAGKIGEQITGPNITIVEDPLNPQIAGIPFDYEGVPRKKVTLVENGIARGVVYDSYLAQQAGVESTGHALPPSNRYGPYPKHMTMAPGNHTLEEMVQSVQRGIYITHFWYINFLNPMATMVTGTTRDGTFLIENGRITKPIRNMRIKQSILEAFSNAEMISRKRELYPQYSVVMLVPAMKINNFTLETTDE